jgi:bacillithiol biosynthesis cysteine-adding enzyme BshC
MRTPMEPFCPPFLAGEPRATALLGDGFRRVESWRDEVAARAQRRVAPALLESLAAQQALLPPSEARSRNLEALAAPGTVVAVTGQQVGLFLGPLYTLYKAATAIAWARALSEHTGARAVPVFWLQTEDHDLAEIASCLVPQPDGPLLRLGLPETASRCSVEHVPLPPQIDALVAQLEQALAPLPHAEQVVALLREAYRPGRSMALAFAQVLAAIFADEGLLVLDPRCPEVARLAAPLYAQALEQSREVDASLQSRGDALRAAGLSEQVKVRGGSPLVFFHAQGVEGARHRLQRDGADRFRIDGGGYATQAELLDALGRQPLLFSTSALLRPVVQDALLPAAVYVGGPAEVGYLAQAAPLHALFGVRPALAAPRARFRLIDPRCDALLRELQLSPADVEAPRDRLLAQLGAARAGARPAETLARDFLGGLPDKVLAMARKHPGLERAARRTQLSVERAVARLAARHARLLAEQDRTLASRIDRLQAALFPEGEPQERVHSMPAWAARFGLQGLKEAVLRAVDPKDPTTKDLRP